MGMVECITDFVVYVSTKMLHTLQQSELVAERIQQRPEYDMGILGLGVLDKKRAINIEKRIVNGLHSR